MSGKPIAKAVHDNEQRSCSAPSCTRRRNRVSAFCKYHERRKQSYGHPQGKLIKPAEYVIEKAEARTLLERNAEHEGVVNAIAWLDQWLKDSGEGYTTLPGARHFHRLHSHGVTAFDILVEFAALWLYSTRYPRRLPDDARLTYALAVNVFRMIPLDRIEDWRTGKKRSALPRHGETRDTGQRIRDTLGMLLLNVAEHCERQHELREQQRRAYRAPLSI